MLGAQSFIGNYLVDELLQNENVFVTAFSRNLITKKHPRFKSFVGDFENTTELENALINQDIVYHLISRTIPATSWDNHGVEITKNLSPTLNLIRLSKKHKIKKICFTSSGGTVYGVNKNINTENTPTNPVTPHGIIKRTIESFLQNAQYNGELNYDIYRISNAYGIGQNVKKGLGFINTSLENISQNKPIMIYGDGEKIRDFIYADDIAKLMTTTLKIPMEQSNIFNVCLGKSYTLNEVIEIIKTVCKKNVEVLYQVNRISDIPISILNNEKIMQLNQDIQLTSIEDGIEKIYKSLK